VGTGNCNENAESNPLTVETADSEFTIDNLTAVHYEIDPFTDRR